MFDNKTFIIDPANLFYKYLYPSSYLFSLPIFNNNYDYRAGGPYYLNDSIFSSSMNYFLEYPYYGGGSAVDGRYYPWYEPDILFYDDVGLPPYWHYWYWPRSY